MTGRAAAKNVRPGDFALSVGKPDKPCPPGWTWVALLDVAEMATGHTPSRNYPEYWANGDIPWVTATDANPADGGVILDTIEQINQKGLDNSAAVLLPAGTVCLSRTGASIGYTVILGRPMATNQGFVNWICTDAVNNWYLLHLFMAERRALFSFGEGTAHKTIYFPEAKAFHVCLPPRNEQDRIVTKIEELFSNLDAGVAALERAKTNLKRYRVAVLKSAVDGTLTADWRAKNRKLEPASKLLDRILAERRQKWEADQFTKFTVAGKQPPKNWKEKYVEPTPPDSTALPQLPEGWCWASVRQLSFVDVGFAFKSSEFSSSGIRLLRGENLEPGALRWNDTRFWSESRLNGFENLLVDAGEIILAMDRPLISSGLKIARAKESDLPCLLVQRMARLRMIDTAITGYLYLSLQSNSFIRHLLGSQTGTQLPHISGTSIEDFIFPLPPLKEQLQIIAVIEERISQITAAQAQIQVNLLRADRLRQSILKRAFDGKLVPQDRNDESASVLLERIRQKAQSNIAVATKSNGKPLRKKSAVKTR